MITGHWIEAEPIYFFPQIYKEALRAFPLKALSSGVLNAKFLAFDTPNTKNTTSSGVLYVLKILNMLQYTSIFNTVRIEMLYMFIIILFISPSETH